MTYFRWVDGRFLCGLTAPRAAARQTLLYALHGAPEPLVSTLETEYFTKQVDDPGAAILQKLISEGVENLSDDDRKVWTRYLMAIHARRPEAVELAQYVGKEKLHENLSKNPEEYEVLREAADPVALENVLKEWVPENFGKLVLPAVIDHEDTQKTILSMKWWLYDFRDSRDDLLTSDRPLIWPSGANTEHFFLTIPIAPRLAFFATKSGRVESNLRRWGASELARRVNESVMTQASTYVYAAHDGHRRFVRARLKKGAAGD